MPLNAVFRGAPGTREADPDDLRRDRGHRRAVKAEKWEEAADIGPILTAWLRRSSKTAPKLTRPAAAVSRNLGGLPAFEKDSRPPANSRPVLRRLWGSGPAKTRYLKPPLHLSPLVRVQVGQLRFPGPPELESIVVSLLLDSPTSPAAFACQHPRLLRWGKTRCLRTPLHLAPLGLGELEPTCSFYSDRSPLKRIGLQTPICTLHLAALMPLVVYCWCCLGPCPPLTLTPGDWSCKSMYCTCLQNVFFRSRSVHFLKWKEFIFKSVLTWAIFLWCLNIHKGTWYFYKLVWISFLISVSHL